MKLIGALDREKCSRVFVMWLVGGAFLFILAQGGYQIQTNSNVAAAELTNSENLADIKKDIAVIKTITGQHIKKSDEILETFENGN